MTGFSQRLIVLREKRLTSEVSLMILHEDFRYRNNNGDCCLTLNSHDKVNAYVNDREI